MNDDYRACEFDPLEPPLKAAVEAVLAESLPDDAIQRVKERAQYLAVAAPSQRALAPSAQGWKTSRSLIGGFVAAALAAAAISVSLLQDRSGGLAFAQMIEKLNAANTVRFHATYQIASLPPSTGILYRDGNRTRAEMNDGTWVSITDIDSRKILNLDMKRKRHQQSRYSDEMAQKSANPVDRLRRVKSDDAEVIGDDVLNDRRTRVYRINRADVLNFGRIDLETTVWIDVESELPAKIVVRDPDPKRHLEVLFEDFVWDEPLDPKLFSLEIPAGFTPIDVETLAGPIEAEQAQPDAAQALP